MKRGQISTIALAPPGKSFYVGLAFFFALVPGTVVLLWAAGISAELDLAHAGWAALAALPVYTGIMLISNWRKAEVDNGTFRLRATFYRCEVPLGQLDLEQARVVDLREKIELKPRLKTNGFAVPGFNAGHFRDRNGNRLFCMVTAPRVVWLPRADGSRIMFSAARPGEALELLRRPGSL